MSCVAHSTLDRAVQAHLAGRLDLAETLYRECLAGPSPSPKVSQFLGVLLFQSSGRAEGLRLMEQAVKLTPNDSEAWSNLGNAYRVLSDGDRAISALKRAIELDPRNASAHCTLSACLRKEGTLIDAIDAARTATRLQPNMAQAHCNLGNALLEAGECQAAIASFQQALYLQPGMLDARQSLVFALHYSDRHTARQIRTAADSFSQLFSEVAPQFDRSELKTIGFLSGDFRQHPVAYFLEPLLRKLSESDFRTVLLNNSLVRDSWTDKLSDLADAAVSVVDQPADRVRALAAEHSIDLLVDLAGHTASNRADAVVRRLAPIQVSYLGFSGTTGLPNLDWMLADPVLVGSHDEQNYSEKVRTLSSSAFCFDVGRVPEQSPKLPFDQNGFITFGSFNNLSKLSSSCLDAWAGLLSKVPNSRLLIKSLHLGEIALTERIFRSMRAQGVCEDRVEVRGFASDPFAAIAGVDIALDSFPYTGATTTCETLACGVPVVTLKGDRYAARMSASILTSVGRTEWIASSIESYVDIASRLSTDPLGLRSLRQTLRSELASSPLCDSNLFVTNFVTALQATWNTTLGAIRS